MSFLQNWYDYFAAGTISPDLPAPAAPLTAEQLRIPGAWTPEIMRQATGMENRLPFVLPHRSNTPFITAGVGIALGLGVLWWEGRREYTRFQKDRERKHREKQRRQIIESALTDSLF